MTTTAHESRLRYGRHNLFVYEHMIDFVIFVLILAAMTPELATRLAARFAALADPNRLRLLHRLLGGEARVGQLAEELDLLQPNVSRHLKVLVQAGLVQVVRGEGGQHYAIRDTTLGPLCELVCGAVRQQAADDHHALSA